MTRPTRHMLPSFGTQDPYVIAEIGVNHDGSLDRALELVQSAADCGADAVKLQWFRAEALLSRDAGLVEYQREAGEQDAHGMLSRLELGREDMSVLVDRIHEVGLHAIATIFSTELVDDAAMLPWDLFKTASPEIVNRPLIERLASTGRSLILSTGGSSIDEVREALTWTGSTPVALLHCVSSYPTPVDSASLAGIEFMSGTLDLPVGYSDHTLQWETGGLAVAAGATILEKHITWNNGADGPDHAASLEPHAFSRYVEFARTARSMLGEPGKAALAIEEHVISAARQSIALRHDLQAGCVLRVEDMTTMRPGGGFSPGCLDELVGRKLARDVHSGSLLQSGDLEPDEVTS